jgi:plasmid stabilization system protein ParE
MQVFVTARAEKNFESIIKHIKHRFGQATVDSFFLLIEKYPSIGKVETGDIRGFQLSPQTRILYRIRGEKVVVLAFFDVRQDPSKTFN